MIDLDGNPLATATTDLCGSLADSSGQRVRPRSDSSACYVNSGALIREREGDSSADPPARPRDNGDFTGQRAHVAIQSSRRGPPLPMYFARLRCRLAMLRSL